MFHAIWSRRLEIFHLATHCNQCLLHIGISGGGVEACPIKLFLLSALGAPAHFNGTKRETQHIRALCAVKKPPSIQLAPVNVQVTTTQVITAGRLGAIILM